MAERRTGGRGGVATDPPALDLEDFQIVKPSQELSRSALPPSQYTPLVELARANLHQKIERTRKVMVEGEDGPTPKIGEDGEPEREPITYSKADAQTFYDELRDAADRMRLTKQRQSLRVVTSPKLKDGPEDAQYRVQWYVLPMGAGGDGNQA